MSMEVCQEDWLDNQMENMKLLYKNDDGVCIVQLPDNKVYYGNGKTFGGIGISANQFLRFNPNMDYVADKEFDIPEPVMKWINEHTGQQHSFQVKEDQPNCRH